MSGARYPSTRLGIYFFYDSDGIVDDYVMHFLRDLNAHLSSLIVVCNGFLSEQGRERLETLHHVEVLVRPNVGFDVWAYKSAIDHLGWEALGSFEEIVLVNFTIMGPVGTFRPMFHEMDSRNLDFWGITLHHGADFDPWGMMPEGVVPLHIQSHFIAVRAPMVRSSAFQRYWDELGPINSYDESVAKHEALFTQRFERAGFEWGVYVDTHDLVGQAYYPLVNYPVEMIEQRRSPIFKRKIFFTPPEVFLGETSNRQARSLADYLRSRPDFDFGMVMRHAIRSANQYDLAMALNLFEVGLSKPAHVPAPQGRVAAIASISTLAELKRKIPFILNLPELATIYVRITTDLVDAVDVERVLVEAGLDDRSEISDSQSEGLTFDHWRDSLNEYTVMCVLEETTGPIDFPTTNYLTAEADALYSVLATPEHVNAIVSRFQDDQLLGMMVPVPPLHYEFFGLYGHEWADRFDEVVSIAERLGVSVALEQSKPPLSPTLGIFWVRPSAMMGLTRNSGITATTAPEVARLLYPLAAQDAGFYVSWLVPSKIAENVIANSIHTIRQLNLAEGLGRGDTFPRLMQRLNSHVAGRDGVAPRAALLFWESGEGFQAWNSSRTPYVKETGGLSVRFVIPQGAQRLRFDPVEASGCIVRRISFSTDAAGVIKGSVVNGIRMGGSDFFASGDPQYLITQWPAESSWLHVHLDEIVLIQEGTELFSDLEPPRASRLTRLRRRLARVLGLAHDSHNDFQLTSSDTVSP